MSKIGDYQRALRLKEAASESQTVGEFAKELGKSTAVLLQQLKVASITKQDSDSLTVGEKHQFLKHQNLHKSQKSKKITITIDPEWKRLIRSVAAQENGAEFASLEYLLGMVFNGESLEPEFQKLINLIVAKAVIYGALPLQKLGRPKREQLDSIGREAAERYWEMIDSGSSYESAVEAVSVEFHKSERHIMRLIAPHKKSIGETLEQRSINRSYWKIMRERNTTSSYLELCLSILKPKIPAPDFTHEDYVDHLDELIQQLAEKAKPLTKKI
jgi:hypothetical protein